MDALSRFFSLFAGLGGDVAAVVIGLLIFALFIDAAMRNSARVGAAMGRSFGALIRFMAPGLSLLIVFLFASVVHAMSVKSAIGVTDRSSPFVHGVVLLCALAGRDFDTCGLTVRYRQAMDEEESKRKPEKSKYVPLGRRPAKVLVDQPDGGNAELLMPENLLPEGYGESREEVNRFPQMFGLPMQPDALVSDKAGRSFTEESLATFANHVDGETAPTLAPTIEAAEQEGAGGGETLSTRRRIHTNPLPIPGEPLG